MAEMIVRVGRLPGKIEELALGSGAIVADALSIAEIDPEGYEVRVNGSPADMDYELADGDTILLVKKIKGNQ